MFFIFPFQQGFVFLYLLQYLKCYSTVVVLQGRDVIVAESKLSLGIYLQFDYWTLIAVSSGSARTTLSVGISFT